MIILVKETAARKVRTLLEFSKEELLEKIKDDNGYHEGICCRNPNTIIRVFFDYDWDKEGLEDLLKTLCEEMNCEKTDWAISCGTREGKVSYHILSKKFCMSINNLRILHRKLHKEHKCIDFTILHVSMTDETECAFLRLPNQSKDGVNKPAPPMRILQGELCDFLVTDIEGLIVK